LHDWLLNKRLNTCFITKTSQIYETFVIVILTGKSFNYF